jgi:hypothetical protein
MPIRTWTHLAVTFEGPSTTTRIYVNGVPVASSSSFPVGPPNPWDFKIANSGGCPNGQRFIGVMDEVRVYDRALTGTEINTLVTGRVPIAIDIKPGSDDNSINLDQVKQVPVALLSTASFDATFCDPASITLAGADVRLIGRGGNHQCAAEDVSSDGIADLVCHVETAEWMVEPGDTSAELLGTCDGVGVAGRDSIRIVPPKG